MILKKLQKLSKEFDKVMKSFVPWLKFGQKVTCNFLEPNVIFVPKICN